MFTKVPARILFSLIIVVLCEQQSLGSGVSLVNDNHLHSEIKLLLFPLDTDKRATLQTITLHWNILHFEMPAFNFIYRHTVAML